MEKPQHLDTRNIQLWKQMSEQVETLRVQEEDIRREREILEKALLDYSTIRVYSIPQHPTGAEGNNRSAIVAILQEKGRSLRITEIAQRAIEKGLIKSAKGPEGVYSIVQTVLNRNSKTTFIKRGRGVWDLRERHNKKLDKKQDEEKSQPIPSLAESANGISIPSDQVESAITDLAPGDAIIFSLKKSDHLLAAREIRESLDRAGYPEKRWGKTGGYFYAVLKRLADRKTILKRKNKYGALPEGDMQIKTNNTDDMNLQAS